MWWPGDRQIWEQRPAHLRTFLLEADGSFWEGRVVERAVGQTEKRRLFRPSNCSSRFRRTRVAEIAGGHCVCRRRRKDRRKSAGREGGGRTDIPGKERG